MRALSGVGASSSGLRPRAVAPRRSRSFLAAAASDGVDDARASAAAARLARFIPSTLDASWLVRREPRIVTEDAEDVVRRLVAVRAETSLAGVELDALLGVWPECLLVDDAGAPHRLFLHAPPRFITHRQLERADLITPPLLPSAASLRARIAALEAAFPGADVRSLVVSQPEVLTHDVARVRLVADAVRAAGKAIPGWIDANPSLVLKLMQSDAAFYYVLDMPAEVTRRSGGGRGKGRGGDDDAGDDDEPVWTKVGVFPSRPKR